MDDTIAGLNISSDNIDSLAIVDNLNSSLFSFDKTYSFSSKSLNISSGNISSHNSGSSNNMSGNNSFGLFWGKAFKSTFWKFGKSFIRRSKNGDCFNSLQGFNKSEITDNFDQSGESTCSNSNIYNISNFSNFGNRFFNRCRLRGWFRCRLRCSNNNIINNMNDTIASSNISSYNIDSLTIVYNLDSSFFSFDKAYSFSSKGLNISSGNISSHDSGSSNNMSCNNGFGLFRGQAFKGAFWKFGKSIIRGSKNGNGFNSLQGFNKTKIANNFDQCSVCTITNSYIYNISSFGSLRDLIDFFQKIHINSSRSRCNFFNRCRCSNNDIVDDMDDTITGLNISSDNIDGLTIVYNLN